MTNVGITGPPRHGKTLKLVHITRLAYLSGYTVLSAMESIKIPHLSYDINHIQDAFESKRSIQSIYGLPEKQSIFINGDELTTLGGYNRMSLTKANIITSFLFMQAGKRRISIGWTAQIWPSIDKNLRKLTSLNIESKRIGSEHNPSLFVLTWKYKDRPIPTFSKLWHPEQFHPIMRLYDTEEPMHPQIIMKK